MEREIRDLRRWRELVAMGNAISAEAIVGVLQPGHGGTGFTDYTIGACTVWENDSGVNYVRGAVIVSQLDSDDFDDTNTIGNRLVIGVLDEDIDDGNTGRIRHTGYTDTVLVQGAVTAGDYIRTSATLGRGESAGTDITPGCFAIALTTWAGPGVGTVEAYVDTGYSYSGTIFVNKIEIDDANFNLDIVGTDPRITFDANDYITYNRAGDYWQSYFGGVAALTVWGAGMQHLGGTLWLGTANTTQGQLIITAPALGDAGGYISIYETGAWGGGFFKLDVYQDILRFISPTAATLVYLHSDGTFEIFPGPLKVDVIDEQAAGVGVTVEGVLMIDSTINLPTVAADPVYVDGYCILYFYSDGGGTDELRVRGKMGAVETQVTLADITP